MELIIFFKNFYLLFKYSLKNLLKNKIQILFLSIALGVAAGLFISVNTSLQEVNQHLKYVEKNSNIPNYFLLTHNYKYHNVTNEQEYEKNLDYLFKPKEDPDNNWFSNFFSNGKQFQYANDGGPDPSAQTLNDDLSYDLRVYFKYYEGGKLYTFIANPRTSLGVENIFNVNISSKYIPTTSNYAFISKNYLNENKLKIGNNFNLFGLNLETAGTYLNVNTMAGWFGSDGIIPNNNNFTFFISPMNMELLIKSFFQNSKPNLPFGGDDTFNIEPIVLYNKKSTVSHKKFEEDLQNWAAQHEVPLNRSNLYSTGQFLSSFWRYDFPQETPSGEPNPLYYLYRELLSIFSSLTYISHSDNFAWNSSDSDITRGIYLIYGRLETLRSVLNVFLIVIFIITSAFSLYLIRQYIDERKFEYALLKANGYSKRYLILSLASFPALSAIFGTIIGILISLPITSTIIKSINLHFAVNVNDIIFNYEFALISIGIILFLVGILSFTYGYFVFKQKTIQLLNQKQSTNINFVNVFLSKLLTKFHISFKFSIINIYGQIFKTLLIIIMFVLASYSLILVFDVENITKGSINQILGVSSINTLSFTDEEPNTSLAPNVLPNSYIAYPNKTIDQWYVDNSNLALFTDVDNPTDIKNNLYDLYYANNPETILSDHHFIKTIDFQNVIKKYDNVSNQNSYIRIQDAIRKIDSDNATTYINNLVFMNYLNQLYANVNQYLNIGFTLYNPNTTLPTLVAPAVLQYPNGISKTNKKMLDSVKNTTQTETNSFGFSHLNSINKYYKSTSNNSERILKNSDFNIQNINSKHYVIIPALFSNSLSYFLQNYPFLEETSYLKKYIANILKQLVPPSQWPVIEGILNEFIFGVRKVGNLNNEYSNTFVYTDSWMNQLISFVNEEYELQIPNWDSNNFNKITNGAISYDGSSYWTKENPYPLNFAQDYKDYVYNVRYLYITTKTWTSFAQVIILPLYLFLYCIIIIIVFLAIMLIMTFIYNNKLNLASMKSLGYSARKIMIYVMIPYWCIAILGFLLSIELVIQMITFIYKNVEKFLETGTNNIAKTNLFPADAIVLGLIIIVFLLAIMSIFVEHAIIKINTTDVMKEK